MLMTLLYTMTTQLSSPRVALHGSRLLLGLAVIVIAITTISGTCSDSCGCGKRCQALCDIYNPCHAEATCRDITDTQVCTCNTGYSGNGHTCTGIIECGVSDACHSNAVCRDTGNGYRCTCSIGYLGDGVACIDIIECGFADNCDSDATCANTDGSYTCTCNPGFVGNGRSCTDKVECGVTDDCAAVGATCIDAAGTYSCVCKNGYTGDGKTCTDIVQCGTPSDDCHNDANCADAGGSYTCTCNQGYVGDGKSCSDKIECGVTDDCAAVGAICIDTVGTYSCVCKNGYTGDGKSCTDIIECGTSDNCETTYGSCTDTGGSFSCVCNAGYAGAGTTGTCADIDECSDGLDDCDGNAACTDTDGSFTCACNSGYSGNGKACSDIVECEVTDDCANNATCADAAGSYSCTCNEGYTGNGQTCTDIVECGTKSDDCDNDATCVDAAGSYTCTCNIGFSGDGKSCTDIDECLTLTDDCDKNATCANTIGSFTCTCNGPRKPFAGDGKTCKPVTCELPEIDNAAHDGEGITFGHRDTVTYTCKEHHGFTPSTPSPGNQLNLTCDTGQIPATWTAYKGHVCKRLVCPPLPVIPASSHNGVAQEYFDGNMVTYTCNEGYFLSPLTVIFNKLHVKCNDAIPTWSGYTAHTCIPVQCSTPPWITRAHIISGPRSDYPLGTTVHYQCASGYADPITGKTNFTSECENVPSTTIGVWSTAGFTCTLDCRFVDDLTSIKLSARFVEPYDHAYGSLSVRQQASFDETFGQQLLKIYKRAMVQTMDTLVCFVRPGSTEVLHVIKFSIPISEVDKAIISLLAKHIFPQSLTVNNVSLSGAKLSVVNNDFVPYIITDVCDYYKAHGKCKNGSNCTIINHAPVCRCPEAVTGDYCEEMAPNCTVQVMNETVTAEGLSDRWKLGIAVGGIVVVGSLLVGFITGMLCGYARSNRNLVGRKKFFRKPTMPKPPLPRSDLAAIQTRVDAMTGVRPAYRSMRPSWWF